MAAYLYRPPDPKIKLWSDLDKIMEGTEGNEIFLVGDLNVDVFNRQSWSELRTSSKRLCSVSTRQCCAVANTLNLVLRCYSKWLHLCNFLCRRTCRFHRPCASVYRLGYWYLQRINEIYTSEDLETALWPECWYWLMACTNMTSEWAAIIRHRIDVDRVALKIKVLSALDEAAPLVCTERTDRRKLCPRMTPELMNLLHRQKSMHRRVVRTKRKTLQLCESTVY